MKLYTVVDTHTNIALATYINRNRATHKAHELDAQYGVMRYIVRASKQLTTKQAIATLNQLPPALIGE